MKPLDLNLEAIPDEATRATVRQLLHLVEQLYADNRTLRAEVQRLRDEIHRLQGEQGQPTMRGKRAPKPDPPSPPDHSSEQERREPQPWKKGPKRHRIVIDRVERLPVDPTTLPPDAEFQGYAPVVVQDLVLRTDNVLFLKAIYYSASQKRTFRAELPPGYTGQYGPGIRALAPVLAYGCQVSEEQIHRLFTDAGIAISAGQVSALLIQDHERFHAEADAVLLAGLAASPWQHLDDTPTRVNGENHACYTLSNPLYTAYVTRPSKERLTVLSVLQGGRSLRYRLDEMAWVYLAEAGVSQQIQRALAALCAARAPDVEWDAATFAALLESEMPRLGPQQRQRIREAGAWAAYWAQEAVPTIHTLVCDDAPQFRGLTPRLSLCWVHDGRHYTKLRPYLPAHRRIVEEFRKRYWEFYRQLRAYRQAPTAAEGVRLEEEFDALFGTRTGLSMLDARIALTQAKKQELLLVLTHPELPLNNNPAELAVRRRVRKRDVSFGPRTEAGRRAWDTFQTLAATAAKLGVSFYHYIHDRVSGAYRLPSLAQVIEEQGRVLNLGRSWAAS